MSQDRAGPVCLADVEARAAASMPAAVWDYVAGGAGDETALDVNTAALRQVRLLPRVLADVARRSAATSLLGAESTMPLAIAPMAYQRLVHPDGELASARAAADSAVPFVTPMLSSVALEEVAQTGAQLWLQLYWLHDRGRLRDLIRRAEAAGVLALMLTVDMPVMGRRLRDLRRGLSLPGHVRAANFTPEETGPAHRADRGDSALATHTAIAFDPSLSWPDLEWLRGQTRLPLILKGMLHPQDARRAAETDIAAVVVSNHGGRQLDRAAPGVLMLPALREAAGERCRVLVDGGVRSGTDILTALALGADGVLLGRPVLWGLAAGGHRGVLDVLEMLRTELDTAMALTGCHDLAAARRLDSVTVPAAWYPPGDPPCTCRAPAAAPRGPRAADR